MKPTPSHRTAPRIAAPLVAALSAATLFALAACQRDANAPAAQAADQAAA
ncbi:MAG: hypothetical protein HOQ01_07210, partial [Lysobacter sp.]|nr:hypothetical protein [Lysobacter sp.]